jgi:hypothetical protein
LNGQVRFEDVPEGKDYTIKVKLDHFTLPAFQFVNGHQQNFGDKIDVKEGGEVVVDLVLAPEHGEITGKVKSKGLSGDKLKGIRIEARNGNVLVDHADTGENGDYELKDIDRPGLIEVRPASSFDRDGRIYRPRAADASQFVLVEPGGSATVDITYEAQLVQIAVGAHVVEEVDGQTERRPFDGVTFQLFEQGKSKPLRELTAQAHAANVFADLPAGSYRIVAVPPPASNGQRLQLTRPPTPALSIRVSNGQEVDLSQEFEFKPVRGSVIGLVVTAHDDTPVPDVAVVLSSQQQPQGIKRVLTDGDGEYEINDLLPGKYRIALEQRVVTALGRRWEAEPVAGQTDAAQTVEVRARATTFVPEFRLVEEEHLISGQVFGPGGAAAPFVTVQIFSIPDPEAKPIDNVLTDEKGCYQFHIPSAGTFYIRVREQDGVAPQLTPVNVSSSTTAPPLFTSTRPLATGGGAGTTTPAPVSQDLNDFPFLTEEVDLGARGGQAPPQGGTGAVGRTVERELREVLGWRPRASDPKGFLAALQQAFTVTEVAGHTEVRWNPRSYSVEIQADLGAITGAQASLHTRAKGTLDQVLPLLDGLKPLRVDPDLENVDAIRAIVRSQLTELVAELGVEGGPRVQRVDQLFVFLLGEPPVDLLGRTDRSVLRDPDKVKGTLGVLRDRLGLDRDRINTIDEEQDFTNFLVVLDHVVSLAESWDAQREFFVRGSATEPFLGTQLVLLSRDLEVIAESVHEVEFAMDSVFLGPAERQTLELRFPADARPEFQLVAGSPPMFVSELLGWVERFATEEGRQLIDEGGRQGVVAFRPTIELLRVLVAAAQVSSVGLQDPSRMPAAYRRQRVQRAFAELAQQLAGAAERVALIRAPVDNSQAAQAPAPAPILQSAITRPPRPRRRPPTPAANEDSGGGPN